MENKILMPIEIKGQTFKNRIMFPPLTTGYEKHGMISEQDLRSRIMIIMFIPLR